MINITTMHADERLTQQKVLSFLMKSVIQNVETEEMIIHECFNALQFLYKC